MPRSWFDVQVRDSTSPAIAPHDDITAEAASAQGAIVAYDAPATSDAVDGDGLASCDPAPGSLLALGNTTVTCSATDAHGNAALATSFEVHVLDTTAPTIDPRANATAEATGSEGALVAFDAPATHDAVDGEGFAACAPSSGSRFPIGSTLVTCDATDAAGNAAASVTFTLTVQDTSAPTIDTHDDVGAEATGADGAMVTYDAPASHDVVDGDGLATCAPASGTTFALGSTRVTCSATDAAGNDATPATFDVLVSDTTAPTIAPHDDITVEAAGADGATAAYDAPATSDAVDGAGAATCSPASGATYALGSTIVTCSATDAAGNAALGTTFQVHVLDTTAPILDAHANVTAEATGADGAIAVYDAPATHDAVDGDGAATCSPASGSLFALGDALVTCGATDAAGNPGASTTFHVIVQDTTPPAIDPRLDLAAEATSSGGATVTYDAPATSDAVDGVGIATCIPASGSLFPLGPTKVSCSAQDAAGNTASSSFNVTVDDATPPVIAPHGDITAEAAGADGAIVTYDAPSVSDAVDGADLASCDPASGSLFALGNGTVTCAATDSHGNAASATTFTVRVVDTTPPAIDAHDDITAEATGAPGAIVAYDAPATSDAVDGAGTATCAPASGSLFALGNATVTCSATDAHGNAAPATTFEIRVRDTTPPMIDPRANASAEATGADGATVLYGAPATHDVVDGDGLATCTPASGSTFALGTTTVACQATDAAGNAAAPASFSITVSDTTAPAIDAHDDVMAEATGADGATVTYGPPTTHDAVDGGGAATCSPASGSTFPLGDTPVSCGATDAAGNHATGGFTVHVVDTTPPTIDAHGALTFEATGPSGAFVTYAAPATHDAVDGEGAALCTPASDQTFALGSTRVSCAATDAHGNAASGTAFYVRVRDATPPHVAPHVDVIAEAAGAPGTHVDYGAIATSDVVDGDGLATCIPAAGSIFALGTTLVSCGATDASGNGASSSFNVTVRDTTPPIIAAHGDITAEATSASGASVSYTAPATSDAVDGAGAATCSPAPGSTFALGGTLVTCRATDAHGNNATPVGFLVTVQDTTAPTLGHVSDVAVEATSAAGAIATYDAPTVSDLADPAPTLTCWPGSGTTFALGDTPVWCAALDAHLNGVLQLALTVHVRDTTAPAIAPHANVTAEATGPLGAYVSYAAPATSDAVDGTGLATCAPASGSRFAPGSTLVTCGAIDAHGNAVTRGFLVRVLDTTAPRLNLSGALVVEATGPSGAAVSYLATSYDLVDGVIAPTCSPASGATFPLGFTAVLCGVTDAHNNTAAGSINVTVRDTTAPTLTLPAGISVNATATSAVVTFNATASDLVSGAVPVTCSPASGSAFALGNTSVTCGAHDAAGNNATGGFTVRVVPAVPPTLVLPGSLAVTATSALGANVTFSASAYDTVDGALRPTCTPASGTRFPVGHTNVTCSVRDSRGLTSTGTFGVNVTYSWSGALLPAMPAVGGANLLVKLKLLGASASIHDLAAKLYLSRPGGAEGPALSTSKAVSDNSFRYDPSADQYVFDLSTKALAAGVWQLRIDLGDASLNTVLVTIKG
jgi:uncharacterized protein YuzB (UPF0349 family)